MTKPLFDGTEWTFDLIAETWDVIDAVGKRMGLSYWDPQIEIITSEQMLNAYSTVAMPVMYNHWSFGKSFLQNERAYTKGKQGLAYEVVINTKPVLAYLMEDNTMTMQALVMAHAVCGHGSFFKNNYLFKEWTDPESILSYLTYARDYVADCEKKYGECDVEILLDCCHALQNYGVDKYKRPPKKKAHQKAERQKQWERYHEQSYDAVMATAETAAEETLDIDEILKRLLADDREFPEENLLYFIEKYSPSLKEWQREIVRIVRTIAQYFYPQMQTAVMNEGWATFIHYEIMTQLHDEGYITDGSYLEFLVSHSGVIRQLPWDHHFYSGINVYALGFAMFRDLKRICTDPTPEDKKWFPDLVGTDYLTSLKEIVENYRDESFILQFLSPKVIRDLRLFSLVSQDQSDYTVDGTHDEDDVYTIRQELSKQYSLTARLPQIAVTGVNWESDRALLIMHTSREEKLLEHKSAKDTLSYLDYLWGFPVELDHENE